MNRTYTTYMTYVNKIIPLLLALGVPLALLPLQGPWGFERSILLLVVFLVLLAMFVATNIATNGSYRTNRTYTILAAAMPVAAALAAVNTDVRWANLTNLEMWAAVVGVLVVLVLPRHNGKITERGSVLALGILVAAVGLIGRIGPIGPIRQGLDYQTSLTVASNTLQNSPLWGAGPGRFGENFLRYKPVEFNQREDWMLRYNGSQSGLLEFATEFGLIGLIGPIGLIGLILADLNRRRSELGKVKLYLLGGLVLVFVAAFALLPYSPGVFWALALLANGLELKVKSEK